MKLKVTFIALFVVAKAFAGEAEKNAQWSNFTTQIEALRTLIKQCDDPFRLSNKLFDLKAIGSTPQRTKDWWNGFNDAIMVEAKITCLLAKTQAKKAAKCDQNIPLREIRPGSSIHTLRAQYVNAELNQIYIIKFDQELNQR